MLDKSTKASLEAPGAAAVRLVSTALFFASLEEEACYIQSTPSPTQSAQQSATNNGVVL